LPSALNILTPDLLNRNESNKEQLIGLIRSGDLLLMAGAGKMPDSNALITHLEKEAYRIDPLFLKREPHEKLIVYTDRILEVLGKKFADIVTDLFGNPVSPLPAHLSLVGLPFRAILTTNYDRILVTAVYQVYKVFEAAVVFDPSSSRRETGKFLKAINDPSAESPRVIHLHGSCDYPASIILSATQYERTYGIKIIDPPSAGTVGNYRDNDWPFLRKMMWALMATRRMLYMGFSMNDEYFRIMHEIVSEDVRQGGTNMHFLCQRITFRDTLADFLSKAEYFKESYGIETIFYEDDDSYTGLPNLINELAQRTGSRGFSTARPKIVDLASSALAGGPETMKAFLAIAKRLMKEND
jgi:hypothetical protein